MADKAKLSLARSEFPKRGFNGLDLLGLFALTAGIFVGGIAVFVSLQQKPAFGQATFAIFFFAAGCAWLLAYALRPYTETRAEEAARR